MNTIYKFELDASLKTLNLPQGAELLSIQMQHGMPQLWAKVDPARPTEEIKIQAIGTGHNCNGGEFIDTVQKNDGTLVFHFFRVSEFT